MIGIKFFIIQPLVCPFSRDLLNSDLSFCLSFMRWSLQQFIHVRRKILSCIFPTNPHLLLQLRRLRNGGFEQSCKWSETVRTMGFLSRHVPVTELEDTREVGYGHMRS